MSFVFQFSYSSKIRSKIITKSASIFTKSKWFIVSRIELGSKFALPLGKRPANLDCRAAMPPANITIVIIVVVLIIAIALLAALCCRCQRLRPPDEERPVPGPPIPSAPPPIQPNDQLLEPGARGQGANGRGRGGRGGRRGQTGPYMR